MARQDGVSTLGDKQRSRRLRRLLPALLGLVAVAIVAAAVYAVYFSSWMDLRDVKVNGDRQLSPNQVLRVADAPVGTPLARVDLDSVAGRVAAMPQVASVDVQREWPHALRIVLVEREPIARLRDRDRWVAIDSEGVVFPTKDPILTSLPLLEVKGGANFADPATLRGLATTVAALPPGVRSKVQSLSARTLDSVTLRLTKGRTVMWGNADQPEAKARVLSRALRRISADRYDVSVPGRLKVRD